MHIFHIVRSKAAENPALALVPLTLLACMLHLSGKLFLIMLLNGVLCYLNPTDLSSAVLRVAEESVCRSRSCMAAGQMLLGLSQVVRWPHPEQKP